MVKSRKIHIKKVSIIFGFIFIVLALQVGINKPSYNSQAQEIKPLELPKNSQLTEFVKYNASNTYTMKKFANITGSIQNSTEINLSFPPNNWNITHLELDFQNISIKEQKDIIEDVGDGFRTLENGVTEALGMELKITDFTVINSIDIYGFKAEASSSPGNIYFLITGWDSGSNEPIAPIYGTPIELNMSNSPGWYTQTFPEPIELNTGEYGLVIDATNIAADDYYFWRINNSASGSDLYMCKYTYRFIGGWNWRDPEPDRVFLHRINKKVDIPYFPSDINLTLNLNGKYYSVNNGVDIGEGNVIIDDVNFKLSDSSLNIPITNNQSLNLFFNINYTSNLHNQLSIDSSLEIGDLSVNKWNLFPEFENYSCDCYFYSLDLPDSWRNIQVYKDGFNVSSDVNIVFENQTLKILSDIITEGADWEILAENIPKNFSISLTETTFEPAKDLAIFVEPPIVDGVLGAIIQDAEGKIIPLDEIVIISDNESFHYLIRSDAVDGIWKATVYWFNLTDAGFASITFEVNIPVVIPPPDPLLILLLIILGGAITGGVIGTYSVVKVRKSKKEQRKHKLVQKFKDLMNIEYLIVTDKVSSLDLFSQSFKKKSLDLSLVSGFLNAIRSFGIELTGSSEQSQVIKLEYHESKIIMSEYKQFRIILIMKETPSYEFLETLKNTTIETDEKFGRFLAEFKGDIRPFKYVERLLIQRLETSFLYPLKIAEVPKTKLSSFEKDLLKRVRKHLESTNSKNFRISYFIDKEDVNPLDVKMFSALIEKRIFQPIIVEPTNNLK